MKKSIALMFILLSTCVFTGCCDGNQHLVQENEFIMEDISMETIEGNSMFAFDVFKQLNDEDEDQNILISPISISTALTMTYQGAATTTKEAMAETLGYTHLDNEKINESYRNLIRYLEQYGDEVELNFANSIWISEGESIKNGFLAVNKDVFDASVTSLDFSKPDAAHQINQWISDETNHKIEKMVESPISKDIVLYLINAMYFKGDWTDRFDEENTFKTQFHKEDGSTSEILMMRRSGKIEFGQGKKYTAVRLSYGSGRAAMYCILPQETGSINDFIAGFDLDEWREVKSSVMERDNVS
ncbi:serpin family protein, partial [bacterium]